MGDILSVAVFAGKQGCVTFEPVGRSNQRVKKENLAEKWLAGTCRALQRILHFPAPNLPAIQIHIANAEAISIAGNAAVQSNSILIELPMTDPCRRSRSANER